jgi:hypothetical protein
MSKHAPTFATSKTAAALFEMRQAEFLALVSEGVLPRPRKIGPHERWDTVELCAIARGDRADDYGDVKW